jgi:hypothetical protein
MIEERKPPVRRRTFVEAVFGGLGITGLSAAPPKPKSGSTPVRPFGRTGVKLTAIGHAGARLALLRTKERARAQVRHAYDLGLNYFGFLSRICGVILVPGVGPSCDTGQFP